MAFGLPAAYETEIDLVGSRQTARSAILATLELAGWSFVSPESDFFIAQVPMSGLSWGETFTISLADEGIARIRSACHGFQLFDWGKNRKNVDHFLAIFSARQIRYASLDDPQPVYLDESGKTPIDRVFEESKGK